MSKTIAVRFFVEAAVNIAKKCSKFKEQNRPAFAYYVLLMLFKSI